MAVSAVIGLTGARILLEDLFRAVDRTIAKIERVFVGLMLLAMTLLVFNEYLARELREEVGDLFGLFTLEGQSNAAVLLMVLTGFVGASLATRERQHLTVDAVERAVSPRVAAWVRRLTRLSAAVLCFVFARASYQSVFKHSQDSFEGLTVYGWFAAPINVLVALLPGEKFGPPSCKDWREAADRALHGCPSVDFVSSDAWIDAKYEAGLDPFSLYAFGYVDAGSRFPLWLPIAFLSLSFSLMALRFLGEVFASAPSEPAPARASSATVPAAIAAICVLAIGCGWWLGEGWLLLVGSVVLVVLGAPLFVGIGVGTVGAWVLLRDRTAEVVIADMFEATKKIELLSIPFFVVAGNLMTKGTIAARLVEVARAIVGGVPGGLGVAGVAACAFFAAISGSSPVTVIAIGSVMFPLLVRSGYSEQYSMGVLTTAGGLGIIIPPSIPMIVYAIIVSGNPAVGVIDPTVLFKAGIGPGLFIAAVLSIYTVFLHWKDPPERRMPVRGDVSLASRVGTALLRGAPSLMLPVLILGGIYNWISIGPLDIKFSVTEAAAIAVLYALLVELAVHRELSWRDLPAVFTESAMQMGALFLIIVIAISLNRYFVFEQLPERATEWMVALTSSKWQFLLLANLFLLVLGCLMDIMSAILIVAPLLAPVAASYGIDPIHFGIMFIVNLEIGYLTPPMGINLFVASTVFERPLLSVIRAVLPFLLIMLFCLAVIVMLPWLSLFLVK